MQPSEVVLTVPADSSYVTLVRTAASAVCARADFTVDALDDLRLAVDEACAIAIADTPAGAELTVTFRSSGNEVEVAVTAPSVSGRPVRTNTFAWTVLSALVDRVETGVSGGELTIRLHAHGIAPVAS